MRGPRHIWSGDWRADSDRARKEAEERAARLRAATRPEADASPSAPPARTRIPARGVAIIGIVAGLVVSGAFAAGALIGDNGGGSAAKPLPAVSSKPLKPRAGQTRAGAVYAAASPAVVSIRTSNGSGTGFLIDRSGTLVTNAHVAGSDDHVLVRFGSSGSSLDAQVMGTDPSSDLAVLSIDPQAVPSGVRPLSFADSRDVRVGDTAIAIGNPFGLDRTATEGIVSGVGRHIQSPNGFEIDSVIQTDAPINPGNSGGPLLDDSAHVIGVNSQIETGGSQGNVGIGFAVPSNTVRQVVPQLKRGDSVKHAFLGLSSSAASPANPDGARVESVTPGGPADRAGIQPGDVITRIDGRTVADPSGISTVIGTKRPGDEVAIEVERGGTTTTLHAKLGNRPQKAP
jgi:putative serine protease PepD